jgi:hypothetical protein
MILALLILGPNHPWPGGLHRNSYQHLQPAVAKMIEGGMIGEWESLFSKE